MERKGTNGEVKGKETIKGGKYGERGKGREEGMY